MLATDPLELVSQFEIAQPPATHLAPNYNIAPTTSIYVVVTPTPEPQQRRLEVGYWGLIPRWAKDASRAASMINARVESAAEKPSYRAAWRSRRAILPADGYYEWRLEQDPETGKTYKQPYFLSRRDGQLLALAGLYEWWRPADSEAEWRLTATILTTAAVDEIGWVHDRMPIHLSPDNREAWLDSHFRDDPAGLLDAAGSAAALTATKVSTRVNRAANNDAQLMVPIA